MTKILWLNTSMLYNNACHSDVLSLEPTMKRKLDVFHLGEFK